jgi:hypothetical protein
MSRETATENEQAGVAFDEPAFVVEGRPQPDGMPPGFCLPWAVYRVREAARLSVVSRLQPAAPGHTQG